MCAVQVSPVLARYQQPVDDGVNDVQWMPDCVSIDSHTLA